MSRTGPSIGGPASALALVAAWLVGALLVAAVFAERAEIGG
jgi:hypothetical protein